jgi:formylglycine-generating enzyme required for sulfatase activity
VWNGKAVGRGQKGFEEVLRRMSGLPHGTRILVYPCLSTEYSSGTSFGLPFLSLDEVNRIVVERKLRLIFSPFDHTGKIHPQLAPFWHFRWAEGEDGDAWVTWKNYDGLSDPEEAVYLWNGKEVGKGLQGFIQVLTHLDEIKPKSKVLICPYYVGLPKRKPERQVPFAKYDRLLDEVVYRRNLIILQSSDENALIKKELGESLGSRTTRTPVVFPGTPPAGAPEKNINLDLGGGVTLALTLVPAGQFVMGTPPGEANRSDDETQHEVTISKPFYMGVYEVTRGQFATFVNDTGWKTDAEQDGWTYSWEGNKAHQVDGAGWRNPGFAQTDMHPVVCVSWGDAAAFCQWLSRKTGKAVRLPTEAEWDYACRAGTRTVYQWGDNPDDGKGWCNAADQTAKRQFPDWTVFNWEDGFVFTAPVGQFRPNSWGLYDMHGNVSEWCADWLGDYPGGAVKDPTGPASSQDRVFRGGACGDIPSVCRSGAREGYNPGSSFAFCGFRVVVSLAGMQLR